MHDADGHVALADVDVADLLIGELLGNGLLHVRLNLVVGNVARRTHPARRLRIGILREHAGKRQRRHRCNQHSLTHASSFASPRVVVAQAPRIVVAERPYKSLPEYDWLNDLLQRGKSGTMLPVSARESAGQLKN